MTTKANVTKGDLIAAVAEQTDNSLVDTKKVVEAFIDNVVKELAEGETGVVRIANFGTFQRHFRKARTARQPNTNIEVQVPAATVPKFKPAKHFKDAVNQVAHEVEEEVAV